MKAAPIRVPCRFPSDLWVGTMVDGTLLPAGFPARVALLGPERAVGAREMKCLEEAIATNE